MSTALSISPSPMQNVSAGQSITFTMRFYSESSGTIVVNANKGGEPWNGSVHYTITGPYEDSGSSVSNTYSNVPAGTYTLVYLFGGPDNCMLNSISPSPTQELSSNGRIVFTMDFICKEPR